MKILATIDFSPASDVVIQVTLRLAKALGAEVSLLHVTPPAVEPDAGFQFRARMLAEADHDRRLTMSHTFRDGGHEECEAEVFHRETTRQSRIVRQAERNPRRLPRDLSGLKSVHQVQHDGSIRFSTMGGITIHWATGARPTPKRTGIAPE